MSLGRRRRACQCGQDPPSRIAFRLRLCIATVVVAVLTIGGVGTGVSRAQPDSVRTKILKEKGFPSTHSPGGALWRTAAVPGWGQYYNRQYYKIPFIYVGLTWLGVRIYRAHQNYLLFDRAHLYGLGQEMEGDNPHSQYESQFNQVKKEFLIERTSRLRKQRNDFRRKRDISILGMGLFYALTLLDAYVSAHLLTFDVGDDLAVRVHPAGNLGPALSASPEVDERVLRFISGGNALTNGIGMRVQVQF